LRERVRQITIGSRIDFVQAGAYHGNTAALNCFPGCFLARAMRRDARPASMPLRHAADNAQPCIAQ